MSASDLIKSPPNLARRGPSTYAGHLWLWLPINVQRCQMAVLHGFAVIGPYCHVARFVAPWRTALAKKDGVDRQSSDEEAPAPPRVRTLGPMTGRQISSVTATALCVKPRGQMTERQLANVDVLKTASTDFCTMRHLAMRLRGLFRGGTVDALDTWLADARASNIHGMRRFARTLRQDVAAVSNAVLEPWSNGQVEGQINRLKMLKRAMYGRAGVDLLRARMFPLEEAGLHRK